jgi:hypothetical protein
MKIDKEELSILEDLYERSKEVPDRTLFISVIFQALLDATKPKADEEAKEITTQRREATSWFFTSVGVTCENFEFICEQAGLSIKDVRKFAHHVINSNEKSLVRNRIIKLLG